MPCSILGLCFDNGKENGNYLCTLVYIRDNVNEQTVETTRVYWGYSSGVHCLLQV